jgi:hypothetical protein
MTAKKKRFYRQVYTFIGDESQKVLVSTKALKGAPKLEETWDRGFYVTQTTLVRMGKKDLRECLQPVDLSGTVT